MQNFKRLFKIFKDKRITTVAGAWVFYFLTALLPIVFLLFIAFGVFGINLHSSILSLIPNEFKNIAETLFLTAENATKGITIFFAFAVLFSGSALLHQMLKDGEFIYNSTTIKRNPIIKRMLSLFALSVPFIIFLALAFLLAFQGAILKFFSIENEVIVLLIIIGLVTLIGFVIILLLNFFVSPIKQRLSKMLIGSLVSLAIITVGTLSFMFYLRFFKPYSAFYGSLASIIMFLIWSYILMLGLVFGVSINASIYEKNY